MVCRVFYDGLMLPAKLCGSMFTHRYSLHSCLLVIT